MPCSTPTRHYLVISFRKWMKRLSINRAVRTLLTQKTLTTCLSNKAPRKKTWEAPIWTRLLAMMNPRMIWASPRTIPWLRRPLSQMREFRVRIASNSRPTKEAPTSKISRWEPMQQWIKLVQIKCLYALTRFNSNSSSNLVDRIRSSSINNYRKNLPGLLSPTFLIIANLVVWKIEYLQLVMYLKISNTSPSKDWVTITPLPNRACLRGPAQILKLPLVTSLVELITHLSVGVSLVSVIVMLCKMKE